MPSLPSSVASGCAAGSPASPLAADTLALVLAGGKGTRLGPLTARRAKPAMPMAGHHRLIDFTLSNCLNSGIGRVRVLTQHLRESLLPHLRRNWNQRDADGRRRIELDAPSAAAGAYQGTADAVRRNLDALQAHAPGQVLILAADHAYRMDYAAMLAEHRRRGARLTVGCLDVPLAQAPAFGVMQVDGEQRICRFAEKPAQPQPSPHDPAAALASMGIYVFDTDFLVQQLARGGNDFGSDLIPDAIAGGGVYAHHLRDPRDPRRSGYWRDVGTIDAYRLANLELAAGRAGLDPFDREWPIGTPAGPRARRGDSIIAGGCATRDADVGSSVLFPRVHIGAGTVLRDSVVLGGSRVGRDCRLRNVVIDEGCCLPDGLVAGFNPARDAERFHVAPGGTVLICPEMLDPVAPHRLSQAPAEAVQWAAA